MNRMELINKYIKTDLEKITVKTGELKKNLMIGFILI